MAPEAVDTGRAPVAVPDSRIDGALSAHAVDTVPWHDGVAVMSAAFDRLDREQRSAFILGYFWLSSGVEAVMADMRGELTPSERVSLAAILQQVASGLVR
ncbi:hypothetical protein OG462_41705 [Streptomyces sp. NBC_01077]|uniref:hypothetical protein n=1 Tax=Streptomyces sp. NBC_01077 TaxID=2903746 RepID=UPI00386CA49F|nr:hypothetical protein OG462_41705 [Streptomyces sp. NBC_01077]